MNENMKFFRSSLLWLVRTAVIMLVLASNCLTTAQNRNESPRNCKVSPDGLPLIGVNVVEKRYSNGTITDINGSYTLTVPGTQNWYLKHTSALVNQEVKVISEKHFMTSPDRRLQSPGGSGRSHRLWCTEKRVW